MTWRYLDAGYKCIDPSRDRATITGREKLVYDTRIFEAMRTSVAVASWETDTDPIPRTKGQNNDWVKENFLLSANSC